MRALERAHGVLLFERHGRRTALTPLGERLHAISRRLFDLEAEAELCLTDAEQLRAGRLRVAADSPAYAMPLLAAVAERFPGVHTTLSTGNAGRVLTDLHAHRADIAYVANVEPDPRMVSWPLFHTSLVAVVAPGHPWEQRGQITAGELAAVRLVTREPGSMTRQTFQHALAKTQLVLTDVLEVDSREAVLAAAAFGVGVGLVAEDELPTNAQLTGLRIEGLELTITEHLVCLAERRDLTVVRAACDLALSLA